MILNSEGTLSKPFLEFSGIAQSTHTIIFSLVTCNVVVRGVKTRRAIIYYPGTESSLSISNFEMLLEAHEPTSSPGRALQDRSRWPSAGPLPFGWVVLSKFGVHLCKPSACSHCQVVRLRRTIPLLIFSLPFPPATPSQPTPHPPKGQVCLRLRRLEQPSRSLLLLWPHAPGSVPIPSAGRLKLLPATAFRAAALRLGSHRTQVSTPCVFIERVHVAS